MRKAIVFILIFSMLANLPAVNHNMINYEELDNSPIDQIAISDHHSPLNQDPNELMDELPVPDSINKDQPAEIGRVQAAIPETYTQDSIPSATNPETQTITYSDPYLDPEGELNITTTTKIEETDVNGVRVTLNVTAYGKVNVSDLAIDYILILDSSGSVREAGWNDTIDWAIDFVQSVKDNDRVAIIRFASGANLTHSLTDNQDRAFLVDKLNNTEWTEGATWTKAAIELAIDEFEVNSTQSRPKFVFMVTDGVPYPSPQQDPCHGSHRSRIQRALQENNIRPFILGVGNWNRYRLQCLVQNPSTDLIPIQNYEDLDFNPEDLSEILQSLVNLTATNIDLQLKFNPALILDTYSQPITGRIGNDLNFTKNQLKENESWIVTIDFGVPGLGYIDVLSADSTLVYLPVNGTQTTVNLDELGIDVLLFDDTPPVVYVPADVTVEAAGSGGTVVAIAAFATDNVDGDLPVTCDPSSGSLFPMGSTVVTCTAVDSNGNLGSASFVITVVDTTPPELTIPASVVLEADSEQAAYFSFWATATDIVDGDLPVSCSQLWDAYYPLGVTTVNCLAADNAGNTASASFTVTVVDTIAPSLFGPADQTILQGLGDNILEWSASDLFPDTYVLSENGLLIDSNLWVSDANITLDISGYISGTYVFEMWVNDTSGNVATLTTTIIVISIAEEFEHLRELINGLDLDPCKIDYLLSLVDWAEYHFDRGHYNLAIKKLKWLRTTVTHYMDCGKISIEEETQLFEDISIIIQHIKLYQEYDCSHHSFWKIVWLYWQYFKVVIVFILFS